MIEPLTYWKKPVLQYLSWPVIVIGSIASAFYGVQSGMLPMAMVVIIAVSVIVLSILLEYSIPYKSDWMANSTERNTDFIHIIFSGALPNVLFQLLMLGVGGFRFRTQCMDSRGRSVVVARIGFLEYCRTVLYCVASIGFVYVLSSSIDA